MKCPHCQGEMYPGMPHDRCRGAMRADARDEEIGALKLALDEAQREVRDYAEIHGPALAALTIRVAAAEKRAAEALSWLKEAIAVACAASNDAERALREAGFEV